MATSHLRDTKIKTYIHTFTQPSTLTTSGRRENSVFFTCRKLPHKQKRTAPSFSEICVSHVWIGHKFQRKDTRTWTCWREFGSLYICVLEQGAHCPYIPPKIYAYIHTNSRAVTHKMGQKNVPARRCWWAAHAFFQDPNVVRKREIISHLHVHACVNKGRGFFYVIFHERFFLDTYVSLWNSLCVRASSCVSAAQESTHARTNA